MKFTDDFLYELRLRCDIEAVISQYVVLKKQGRRLSGLCPFHSEKTPSFNVSPDKQLFYCFGCQAGGDVVSFIMRAENLSYPEAVAFLAEKAGLALPDDGADDGTARLKARIYEINRETARFYHSALLSPIGENARKYIEERQLSQKTVTRFGIGYAPDSWDSLILHLRKKGYTDAEMAAASVATKTRNGHFIDFFRNRLMFPIIDVRGNVVAFGGRKLSAEDNGPKYINSPETPVFVKSRSLYALNFAKSSEYCDSLVKSGKERFFILCEGYMDVIALHQAGFDNAVAPLGTALTEQQVKIISKYASDVIIATDSDEAGQKAAKRSYGLIDSAGLGTKMLKIPGAKDPDEYIKKFGSLRFSSLLAESMSAAESEILSILAKYDVSTDLGKIEALKEVSKLLAGVSNAIERDVYITRLATKLSVSHQAISQNVNSLIKQRANAEKRRERQSLTVQQNGSRDTVNPQKRAHLSAAVCEEWIIGSLFVHPDFFAFLKRQGVTEDNFITDWGKKMFSLISGIVKNNVEPELITLSGSLTPDEMSRMAAVITKSGSKICSSEQFCELIDSLAREKEKLKLSRDSIKEMDDQSLMALIEKIGNNKK